MHSLTGKLTIARATELAASIGHMLADEDEAVVLDLGSVTAADVSFLQILCAAHRSALRDGKTLSITSPSEEFLRTVKTMGFERTQACAGFAGEPCLLQAKQGA